MSKYDAVLVPGGGVIDIQTPQRWVQERLDKALELSEDNYIIALSAGTTHKPPLRDTKGFPVFESVVSANYLIQKGYDPRKILVEYHSYDTIGNAFFARATHTDPQKLRCLAVVTSAFHMDRTRKIFDWIFSLPPLTVEHTIDYFPTDNVGMKQAELQSRLEGEQRRIESLEKVMKEIGTLGSLHGWLFKHHNAYAVGSSPEPTEDPEIGTY